MAKSDPVTWNGLEDAFEALRKAIAPHLERLHKDLDAALVHIKELEERPPSVSFGGTWRAGKEYDENALVQHQGSAWIARAPNRDKRPNEHHATWRLVVKRGQLTETGRE
jgi:hypothetical protein